MMALIHGTVGLQHASMAIYNAYADRVPIYMVVGNHADSAARGAGVQSYHSANDMAGWCATSPSGTISRFPSGRSATRPCGL